ncbi:HlyD family secretion protein [Methylobacterium sp. E-065]|uniref:HlyD family secretion protein n=1 Tax=Methylobacterium sp. E-065 TaxID=2836583 RepID=UPI001FB8EF9C|nr:HlyD family secretion protein [Methylobacterium sp. E-065]MCJ2016462.1 HlyD family secretion protein [Methylobacterium sp. E-065]
MSEMPRSETFQKAVDAAEWTRPEVGTSSRVPVQRHAFKRIALVLALLAGTGAGANYGYEYWTTGQYLVSTDDAYVKADYTTIAPKVSGYIADVLVADNQTVRIGQVLARIDDRDFRTSLARAQADVAAAEATVRNLGAQIVLQRAVVDQQDAQIALTQASLKSANAEAERYQSLVKTGSGTLQRAQATEAGLSEKTAQLRRDRAAELAAEQQIEVLTTEVGRAEAQRDHARALARQAELNLSYTVVTAAVDGTVGSRTLRVGQYVQAGTQLMAVVPLDATYIVANYKETQLTDVRPGQPVEIEVDTFAGHRLKGRVDSLSPASGLEFALLPPDNATGNFTKIVQRIPVKIVLEDRAASGTLRAGMSVEATIDIKNARPDTDSRP